MMTTNTAEVASYIQREIERRRKDLIHALRYLGEECINHARDSGTYTDRTGNLRASIGYIILEDGKPITSPVLTGGSQEGKEQGEKAINQAIAEVSEKGIVLIVVAGMHYAKYVEARGYDVISSAQLLAEEQTPILLNKLRQRWQKKK